MITITAETKEEIYLALYNRRKLFDGSNGHFAKMWGLSNNVWSRMHNGEREGLITDSKWILLAQELDVPIDTRAWKLAKTDVFNVIEEEILWCKAYSKARICVDECGIGKTFTARYLSRSVKNCFYIDSSQAKTVRQFIKLLAKQIGADQQGSYYEIKSSIKAVIKSMTKPIIIVDEAGDLEYKAFLELKELWNATENYCGWYMMGADGLRAKIERGINNQTVGYAEIFSRFSEKFTTIVPRDRQMRNLFYKKLISDVLSANNCPASEIATITKRCLSNDSGGYIGGLRRAESLMILS